MLIFRNGFVALAALVILTGFAFTGVCGADEQGPAPLTDVTVGVLVAQEFEDSELASPMQALEEAGARVVLVAEDAGKTYTGKHGNVSVTADVAAAEVTPDQFDGLVIPGGHAPATLRQDPHMVGLARKLVLAGKPVAAICHGPQVLVTAHVLTDRRATCYKGVREELTEAGADYLDQAVVIDGNIITSRTPRDLPQFNEALIEALKDAR